MTPLERYTAAFYTRWLVESRVTDMSWLTLSQVQKDVLLRSMESAIEAMAQFQSGAMLVAGSRVRVSGSDDAVEAGWGEIGETAAGQVFRLMLGEIK